MEAEAEFRQDLAGAALMIALGIGVVTFGVGYRVGELTRMGAGYVPVVIGTLLIVVGALIGVTARSSRRKTQSATLSPTLPSAPSSEPGRLPAGPGDGVIQWRGWSCVLGGVAAFVVLGDHVGLVAAIFGSVFIAALGDRANSLRDCVLLAAGLTIAGVAIFSYGLKLTFPLFTWG